MLNFDKRASVGPIRIEIAVTSACNYKCCFCHSHSYLKADCIEPTFMDKELLHNLFRDLKELGAGELLLAGDGEPFLSRDLVNEIKQHGGSFKTEVLTNGSALELVDEELFGNLHYLTISLNSGNGASHQVTHGYKGENQFGGIVENIERLLKLPDGKKKIKLNYVITADNYHEIEDFIKKAIKWDVSFMARPVSIDFPESSAKRLDRDMLAELNRIIDRYLEGDNLSGRLLLSIQLVSRACQIAYKEMEESKNLYPCYAGFIQPYIASNGDVLLCADGQKRPVGNLNTDSYASIWKKKESVALRLMATQMHKTRQPIVSTCYDCSNAQYHSQVFHNIYSKIPVLSGRLENNYRKLGSLD